MINLKITFLKFTRTYRAFTMGEFVQLFFELLGKCDSSMKSSFTNFI